MRVKTLAMDDIFTFPDQVWRGHPDEDKMDRAMSDIQGLIDRYKPGPKMRDRLNADPRALRMLRAHHE